MKNLIALLQRNATAFRNDNKPYQALGLGILIQALKDLNSPDRESAESFLFSKRKSFAEHRQLVFDLAGVDSDWLGKQVSNRKRTRMWKGETYRFTASAPKNSTSSNYSAENNTS